MKIKRVHYKNLKIGQKVFAFLQDRDTNEVLEGYKNKRYDLIEIKSTNSFGYYLLDRLCYYKFTTDNEGDDMGLDFL